MITIITESTADLSPELISRYSLGIVPLLVNIAGKTYKDGLDIDLETLFKLVEETGTLPQTAAPSIIEFAERFNIPGEIIYIGISSKLSATFQNATLAAQNSGKETIHLIDSLNLSTGIGLLALQAAELRDQGLPAAEIAAQVTRSIPKIRTSFVVDTMEYIYKGGRCTAIQNLVGSLLKIRPIIEVKPDGTLGVKDKLRGSRKKALDSLLADLEKNLPQLDRHRLFVTHSGCQDDAQYLAVEIKKMCTPDEVYITRAGAVISSHCGPNTIGILYLLK